MNVLNLKITSSEICSFGDYKAAMDYLGYRYNCTQLIKYFPELCYQKYYESKCCHSCDKLRKQKPQGLNFKLYKVFVNQLNVIALNETNE